MLNDIKAWLLESATHAREIAQQVAWELSNESFMHWAGTVWFVLLVAALCGSADFRVMPAATARRRFVRPAWLPCRAVMRVTQ